MSKQDLATEIPGGFAGEDEPAGVVFAE